MGTVRAFLSTLCWCSGVKVVAGAFLPAMLAPAPSSIMLADSKSDPQHLKNLRFHSPTAYPLSHRLCIGYAGVNIKINLYGSPRVQPSHPKCISHLIVLWKCALSLPNRILFCYRIGGTARTWSTTSLSRPTAWVLLPPRCWPRAAPRSTTTLPPTLNLICLTLRNSCGRGMLRSTTHASSSATAPLSSLT